MTMDFGVVLQTNPPASRVVQLAKLAEAHMRAFDEEISQAVRRHL